MVGLPKTLSKNNAMYVIVDGLTKSAYLIVMANTWTLDQLTRADANEIVRLHGVRSSIVSYQDMRFQARFWKKCQEAFGTKLNYSMTFHPTMDE